MKCEEQQYRIFSTMSTIFWRDKSWENLFSFPSSTETSIQNYKKGIIITVMVILYSKATFTTLILYGCTCINDTKWIKKKHLIALFCNTGAYFCLNLLIRSLDDCENISNFGIYGLWLGFPRFVEICYWNVA